jgi:hypothetical protein
VKPRATATARASALIVASALIAVTVVIVATAIVASVVIAATVIAATAVIVPDRDGRRIAIGFSRWQFAKCKLQTWSARRRNPHFLVGIHGRSETARSRLFG